MDDSTTRSCTTMLASTTGAEQALWNNF